MKGRIYGFGSAADPKVLLKGSSSFSTNSRVPSDFSSPSQGLSEDQMKEVTEKLRQEMEEKMEERLRQQERQINEAFTERMKELIRNMQVEHADSPVHSPQQGY